MRKALIVTHRWVALVVSLVLIATAASGAVLVFEGAIDRALNPTLWRVVPNGTTLPIDTLVARVEAKYPAARVAQVTLAPTPDRAWTMVADGLTVFVDPYSGAIKGTRTPQESQATFARRMHVFHVEVFGGPTGRTVVAIATGIGLFLVLTGIILWWPDKLVRIRTTANWKRINFDLHHALGIIAALVLIVITSSGLVIHFDSLASLIKRLDGTPAAPPPPQQPGPADAPRLSFDAVVATARAKLPGGTVMFVSLGTPKAPATVAIRFPEDRTPGGRSRVFVDHFSGALLGAVSTREAQLGTRIDNLKRSLHTGDVLGKPTEAVWLLAALVMISQAVTGALMWWNARRSRLRT